MRIGWILYGALEQLTGGYVYDAQVVAALRQHGDNVELLSLSAGDPEAAHNLIQTVLGGEFELIVGDELCHSELATLFDTLGRLKAQGRRVPRCMLLVHHLTAWEGRLPSPTETRVVQTADGVIATSQMSAHRLALEFGVQAAVCVPGGDRLQLLSRRTNPNLNAPLELLFVGTWTERKGLLVLIQALGRLHTARYHLRILGEPDREPLYRQLVEAELLEQPLVAARTQICGAVSDATLAQIYASSDVLVLPSYFEGYGMVLCEALRAGLALVASDVGAVSEVARAGSDARLIPAGDVSALARVLDDLITDRAEVKRLQDNAAQRSHVTWRDVGNRFRDVLGAALG